MADWKFEHAMDFLKKTKTKRLTTSSITGQPTFEVLRSSEAIDDFSPFQDFTNLDALQYAAAPANCSFVSQEVSELGLENAQIVSGTKSPPQNLSSPPNSPFPQNGPTCRGKKRSMEVSDDTRLLRALTKRLEEKQESHRMMFLKSLLPQVERMSEDTFIDFQINVLQLLRNPSD